MASFERQSISDRRHVDCAVVITRLFMANIVRGQLVALFAFDIGYEVTLDKLGSLFAAELI